MAGHEHTCAFREAHDPETLKPLGPACGKPAMQEIYWHDGRVFTIVLRARDARARW